MPSEFEDANSLCQQGQRGLGPRIETNTDLSCPSSTGHVASVNGIRHRRDQRPWASPCSAITSNAALRSVFFAHTLPNLAGTDQDATPEENIESPSENRATPLGLEFNHVVVSSSCIARETFAARGAGHGHHRVRGKAFVGEALVAVKPDSSLRCSPVSLNVFCSSQFAVSDNAVTTTHSRRCSIPLTETEGPGLVPGTELGPAGVLTSPHAQQDGPDCTQSRLAAKLARYGPHLSLLRQNIFYTPSFGVPVGDPHQDTATVLRSLSKSIVRKRNFVSAEAAFQRAALQHNFGDMGNRALGRSGHAGPRGLTRSSGSRPLVLRLGHPGTLSPGPPCSLRCHCRRFS